MIANDWNEELRDRFFAVMEQCDKETMLQTQPTPDCLEKAEAYISDGALVTLVL